MKKMMNWLEENLWTVYGYSVGIWVISAGAMIAVDSVLPQCEPDCHPALPTSIKVSRRIMAVATIGALYSGIAASAREPR